MIHRPEDGVDNGQGLLVPNKSRITEADADLVGTLRFKGQVIRIRGWVEKTPAGLPVIRLNVRDTE